MTEVKTQGLACEPPKPYANDITMRLAFGQLEMIVRAKMSTVTNEMTSCAPSKPVLDMAADIAKLATCTARLRVLAGHMAKTQTPLNCDQYSITVDQMVEATTTLIQWFTKTWEIKLVNGSKLCLCHMYASELERKCDCEFYKTNAHKELMHELKWFEHRVQSENYPSWNDHAENRRRADPEGRKCMKSLGALVKFNEKDYFKGIGRNSHPVAHIKRVAQVLEAKKKAKKSPI